MKVLDTSAILHGDMDFSQGGFLVTNAVLSEVLADNAKLIVNQGIRRGLIQVKDPKEASIKKILSAAKASGDQSRLSSSDIAVLALALEESAEILSDDYSIQNVAKSLGVKFVATAQEGIKKELVWEKVCPSCRKKQGNEANVCCVCGTKTKSVGRRTLEH